MKRACDILMIDDEAVVLQGVARICDSEGITVDTASSGREGLERLRESPHRLIICDIMMGDIDGFEFLAEAGRRGNRAPVIMATGHSTMQNAVRSLQCGAIDYLSKPFTADELMAVVRRGLNYAAMRPGDTAAPPQARPCPPQYHRLGYVSWAAIEPVGTVQVGINDLFVKTLKGISGIELSPLGAELVQGTSCASITSADGLVHGVMCPVNGSVIEAHSDVVARPSMVEADPYGTGWLYRILPTDLEYSLRCLTSGSGTNGQINLSRKGAQT